jgi:hypothetical protein
LKEANLKLTWKHPAAPIALCLAGLAAGAAAQVSNQGSLPPITVLAKNFDPKGSLNVALGGPNNSYGADVLLNAPPYTARPNTATYNFMVPQRRAGKYRLDVEYAAQQSRPVAIYLNGKLVAKNALSATTGCWLPSCQQVKVQVDVMLRSGENTLVVKRQAVFPHLRKFIFLPYAGNPQQD